MTGKRGDSSVAYAPSDAVLSRSPELMRRGSVGMTRKVAGCPFFCHPEAKPKGLLRRFFPFASLRVRMTKKRRGRVLSL